MRILFIISLNFFAVLSYTQPQNFIVRSEAIWSTVEVHCLPIGSNYSTYHIKFEEDSIKEGITYQKIWRCNDEGMLNWFYYGLIQEDEQHSVFFEPVGYSEGKIYDFGVTVGDSISALNPYLNSFDTLHFTVIEVDSIMLMDKYRKRISLYEYINGKEEVWIEGLGSLYGILNSCNNAYGGLCGGYETLCYEEDNVLVYQNPAYGTCHYENLVRINDVQKAEIVVSPNPASSYISIQVPEIYLFENDLVVELYSTDGKKIVEKKLAKDKNIIYLPLLKTGLYFLKVNNKQFYFSTYKILVD